MGKNKKKNKDKVKGIEKTAAKTEKKLASKFNKHLSCTGEENIESILAQIEKEEQNKLKVTEVALKTPPTRRCFASLTAHPYKDELILFGGELCSGDSTALYNDLFIYKITTGEWILIKSPSGPPPISSHQAVAVPSNKGELWIFGGEYMTKSQSQYYHFKDLWVYSLDAKRWTKVTAPGGPSARSGHRMVLCKRQLIVFGGYFDNARDFKYYNDLYSFNLDDRKWTKLEPTGNPPAPRSGFQMAVTAENKILIWGGYSRIKIKKDVEKGSVHSDMFLLSPERGDTTGLKWKWSPFKPGGMRYGARSGVTCTFFNNKAFTFGGSTDHETEEEIDAEFHNDLHVLNLDKFIWNEVIVTGNKTQKKSRRRKKDEEGDGEDGEEDEDEEKDEKEPESQIKPPVTESSDGVFTLRIGQPQSSVEGASSSTEVQSVNNPHPRINTSMAIKGSKLFLYGGLYEDVKKDIDYTLNDFYCIDIKKFDEWKELIAPDFESQTWEESSTDEDDDEEEEEEEEEEKNENVEDKEDMEVDSDSNDENV